MKKAFLAATCICLYNAIAACTCIGQMSVKKEIKKTEVVFVGKALSMTVMKVNVTSIPGMEIQKAVYRFAVSRLYKGKAVKDTVEIITGMGGGDCGFEFSLGNNYVVYAVYKTKYYAKGETVSRYLYTDICRRTQSENKEEIESIEKYKKPGKLMSH